VSELMSEPGTGLKPVTGPSPVTLLVSERSPEQNRMRAESEPNL